MQLINGTVKFIGGTTTSEINSDCGCGYAGADNRGQTDCGVAGSNAYTYEGTTQSAYQSQLGIQTIAACSPSISNSTNYYLTADLSCGVDTVAIDLSGKNTVKIDLNGHTITGKIPMTGNFNGNHIFNGTINCTSSSSPCIGSTSGSTTAVSDSVKLHHLTILNSQNGTNAYDIQFDWAPTANASGINGVIMAYLTTSNTTCTGCSRAAGIYVSAGNTNTNVLVHNHSHSCAGDAQACQAFACYQAQCEYRDSNITLNTNTTAQDFRGFLADGGPSAVPFNVHNIKITANNNRSFRVRSRSVGNINDCLVSNSDTTTTGAGAIHLDDNLSTNQQDYSGMYIRRINFKNPVSGPMVYAKGGYNYNITNITLTGSAAGSLVKFTNWSSAGVNGTMSICASDSFSASANILALKPGADTSTITAYNAGSTDAASTGTVNNNIGPTGTPPGSCPF